MIRAAQNIQNFKNQPNNHKVMSITVHLKNGLFVYQELAKILDFRQFLIEKMDLFSNEHNFVTIGSILEILDVLSSPNHVPVASNFCTSVR